MASWTSLHWRTFDFTVDGEAYEVTIVAPWYVPLWWLWLWRRRRIRRRAYALPRATVVRR